MAKVRAEKSGPVQTIWLTRPEKRNALDGEMLAALAEIFAQPLADGDRVAVLRAEGPVFCAGLDLAERRRALGDASPIERLLHAIETYPLPVVAVVQGAAIAGGNELALHCDFVVASSAAAFGMSLAQIGLAPSWFLAKKLLEVAGPVAAREILLLGEPLSARRMYELGVIARVVPPEQLEAAADAIVGRLAANAPLSLRAMKQLLVREMAFRDGIEHGEVDTLVAEVRQSDDAREGIAAWLARREPRFVGR